MEDNYKKLVKKYVLKSLKAINKSNYLEGLPSEDNQEEQKAFSEALRVVGRLLAEEPGAVKEILEILNVEP